MKVGDLVKYVGSSAMYRDRVGVVVETYGFIVPDEIDSALVHFVGIEGKGRDAPVRAGHHPMSLDELKILLSPP